MSLRGGPDHDDVTSPWLGGPDRWCFRAGSSICGSRGFGRGADVRGADVRGADIWGADIWGADVRGADVRGGEVWGEGAPALRWGAGDLHPADLSAGGCRCDAGGQWG